MPLNKTLRSSDTCDNWKKKLTAPTKQTYHRVTTSQPNFKNSCVKNETTRQQTALNDGVGLLAQ